MFEGPSEAVAVRNAVCENAAGFPEEFKCSSVFLAFCFAWS